MTDARESSELPVDSTQIEQAIANLVGRAQIIVKQLGYYDTLHFG